MSPYYLSKAYITNNIYPSDKSAIYKYSYINHGDTLSHSDNENRHYTCAYECGQ